jgi:hypothetical protein
MKRAPWVLACIVLSVEACVSRSSTPAQGKLEVQAKLSEVEVSIYGVGEARVGPMLMDRKGRRTGWDVNHAIGEITGCAYGAGSEEGIPDEDAPEDTTQLAPADTVPGHREPTPIYHYFSITDSLGHPGLLSEGGCGLRLAPDVGGRAVLAVSGRLRSGAILCKDTTSVTVKPGVSSVWWLSWKATGDSCVVKITRVEAERTTRPRIR